MLPPVGGQDSTKDAANGSKPMDPQPAPSPLPGRIQDVSKQSLNPHASSATSASVIPLSSEAKDELAKAVTTAELFPNFPEIKEHLVEISLHPSEPISVEFSQKSVDDDDDPFGSFAASVEEETLQKEEETARKETTDATIHSTESILDEKVEVNAEVAAALEITSVKVDEAKENLVKEKVLAAVGFAGEFVQVDWVDVDSAEFSDIKNMMAAALDPAGTDQMDQLMEQVDRKRADLMKNLGKMGEDGKAAFHQDWFKEHGGKSIVFGHDLRKHDIDLNHLAKGGAAAIPAGMAVHQARAMNKEEQESIEEAVDNYFTHASMLTALQTFGLSLGPAPVVTSSATQEKTTQETHLTAGVQTRSPVKGEEKGKKKSTKEENAETLRSGNFKAMAHLMQSWGYQLKTLRESKEKRAEEAKEVLHEVVKKKELHADELKFDQEKAVILQDKLTQQQVLMERKLDQKTLDLLNEGIASKERLDEEEKAMILATAIKFSEIEEPNLIQVITFVRKTLKDNPNTNTRIFEKEQILIEKLGRFIRAVGYSL